MAAEVGGVREMAPRAKGREPGTCGTRGETARRGRGGGQPSCWWLTAAPRPARGLSEERRKSCGDPPCRACRGEQRPAIGRGWAGRRPPGACCLLNRGGCSAVPRAARASTDGVEGTAARTRARQDSMETRPIGREWVWNSGFGQEMQKQALRRAPPRRIQSSRTKTRLVEAERKGDGELPL